MMRMNNQRSFHRVYWEVVGSWKYIIADRRCAPRSRRFFTHLYDYYRPTFEGKKKTMRTVANMSHVPSKLKITDAWVMSLLSRGRRCYVQVSYWRTNQCFPLTSMSIMFPHGGDDSDLWRSFQQHAESQRLWDFEPWTAEVGVYSMLNMSCSSTLRTRIDGASSRVIDDAWYWRTYADRHMHAIA